MCVVGTHSRVALDALRINASRSMATTTRSRLSLTCEVDKVDDVDEVDKVDKVDKFSQGGAII